MKHYSIMTVLITLLMIALGGCAEPSYKKARPLDQILRENTRTYKGEQIPLDNDADYIPPIFYQPTPAPLNPQYPRDLDYNYQYPYPVPVYPSYDQYQKQKEEKDKNRVFKRPLFY